MKRTAIALLLSGLTLVGGHFFNRRWDWAVLVFATLVLWGTGSWVLTTWMLITHVLLIAAIQSVAGGQLGETLSTVGLDKLDNQYNFQHHLHFGGRPEHPGRLSKPPAGDGYLGGRFLHSGKPAAGITLRLTLNDKYETDTITTDANGVFTVRIPPGQWRVNQVSTRGWKNKPEKGSFHR